MFFQSECFEIAGVSCAVPDEIEYVRIWNDRFGESTVEKFIQTTGVKQRFVANNLRATSSDLCCTAARQLIDKGLFSPDEIDAVIFMSVRRDYENPATAFVIQHRLGLKEGCVCLDVPLGCSAYVNGLMLANSLILSGCRTILLMTGESLHKFTENPKSIPSLFGAAGSTTLIRKKERHELEGLIRSFGNDFKLQIVPYGGFRHPLEEVLDSEGLERSLELCGQFYMDGFETMRFSLGAVVDCIKDMMNHFGDGADDFNCFVLHQSNAMIIDGIAKKMKFPRERVFKSIECYGNTSGASIPLTLCHCFGNLQDTNLKRVLACGYGIGLSAGTVSFSVQPQNCLPVVRTKEHWDDAIEKSLFC